jgi:hypothetical protein
VSSIESIQPGARIKGLDPAGVAEVVSVSRFGSDAVNLVFRVGGKVAERLVYLGEETGFEFVNAGRAYPQFGYAEGFDEATGKYHKLIWAKNPPEFATPTAMIVREAEAQKQLKDDGVAAPRPEAGSSPGPALTPGDSTPVVPGPVAPGKPRRFYGSVELDMVRPVKSFDAILNAVVMELQRTHGAKVKLPLGIEAEASGGFADSEVGVVRDNARQLKFKSESTGFEE